jgi:hypothetical protein
MNIKFKARIMPLVLALVVAFAALSATVIYADPNDKDKGKDGDKIDKCRSNIGKGSDKGDKGHDRNAPISLLHVITIPGNPVTSADISWVDNCAGTDRYYFADRSNFGVDIIDAEKEVYVGRVSGMAGNLPSGGGTAVTNGPGPNGVLVTPNRKLWAGDGNSTTQVADVNPDSPTYLSIIGSANTSISACDDGTNHYCGRADELGYDPEHNVILIANPGPLSVTAPHASVDPYATFISADPPYTVLGHIILTGAGGAEQPLWDPELHRFFLTVPGKIVSGVIVTPASIKIINTKTMMIESSRVLDCNALAGVTSVATTGEALGEGQRQIVSACGQPIIFNAVDGSLIKVITQVGGGDEVWADLDNDHFYVTGPDTEVPAVQSLGVIDTETSTWLQNVADVRGKNPAAFEETNHVFTIVQINAAIAAAPATDNSICATSFGFKGTGCVAVFGSQDQDH